MRIYIWDINEKKMLNYLCREINFYGYAIKITHPDGGTSLFNVEDYNICQIKEHEE